MNRCWTLLVMTGVLTAGCAATDGSNMDANADMDADADDVATSRQELVVQPGADVRFTVFAQTLQTNVDQFQQFRVRVRNFGSADANPTTLSITFPVTQTSPQTFLLGSLQAVPTGCSLAGRTLTCALGRLRYNGQASGRERTIDFGYRIPVTTQALALSASVVAVGEPAANATDNTATLTAGVNYRAVAVTPGVKTASHCTGTTLTSYFECTKFPSSIASHSAEYHSNGTITFPQAPGYSGTWTQADPTRLHFEYLNGGIVEAVFDGRGADANCFEGITRFYDDDDNDLNTPPVESPYRAPYRVCF